MFLKKIVVTLFKFIATVYLVMFLIGSVLLFLFAITEREILESGSYIISVFSLIAFALSFWLLSKLVQKKKKLVDANIQTNVDLNKYKLDTPPEILRDLKKSVALNAVADTLRILDDCKNIVKSSKNIETVFSRLELGAQKSFFLKQLEQIGKYNKKPSSDEFLDFFIGQKENILFSKINDSYKDMIQKAEMLKTEKGRQAKIAKYFEEIDRFADDFEFTKCEGLVSQLKEKHGLV